MCSPALSQTVPLARTMAEKVTAQRNWAIGRARNASTDSRNLVFGARKANQLRT